MIDDESLMHINDSIFFMYVENAVKWRKLTVTEASEEYNFWLEEVKAQVWDEAYTEGYRHGTCDVEPSDNPYRGEK
jgi:hypothetical protein